MKNQKLIYVSAAVCWLMLVAIQCLLLLDFFVVPGILAGVLLVLLMALLAAVRIGVKFGRWKWTCRFGLALVLAMASVPAGGAMSSALKSAGMRDARPVIAALKKFKADQGHFPAALDELVPQYLTSVPGPAFLGTSPYRFHSSKGEFDLSFELPDWKICGFDSASGKWAVYD